MLNEDQLAQVRAFFLEFTRAPLYDTGFGDTVIACGAHTVMSNGDLLQCACYIQGAADLACRSQPWGTRQWHICHVVSVMCGTLRFYATLVDAATDSVFDYLLGTYHQKLTNIVQEKLADADEESNR